MTVLMSHNSSKNNCNEKKGEKKRKKKLTFVSGVCSSLGED